MMLILYEIMRILTALLTSYYYLCSSNKGFGSGSMECGQSSGPVLRHKAVVWIVPWKLPLMSQALLGVGVWSQLGGNLHTDCHHCLSTQ